MAVPLVRDVRVGVPREVLEAVGSPGHVFRLVGLRGRRVLREVRAVPTSWALLRVRADLGAARRARGVAFPRIFHLIRVFGPFLQNGVYRRLQIGILLRRRRLGLLEIRNLHAHGFLGAHVRTRLYHLVAGGGFIHHGGDRGRGVEDQRKHSPPLSSV